jgi:hypothetical protein
MTKVCTYCKVDKPISNFYPRKDRPGSVIANCKQCTKINNKRYRDPAHRKKWAAKYYQKNKRKIGLKKYGITVEQYQLKLDSQLGKCAICKKEPESKRLFVDHNHSTNKVRGLLCSNCNFLIGLASESKETLQNSIEYLIKYEKETAI